MAQTKLLDIITFAATKKASDVHITFNHRPRIRIDSELIETEFEIVTESLAKSFLEEVTSPEQRETFRAAKELDFSFEVKGAGFCRVNAFYQRNQVGMAVRILPSSIWSFEECGLPAEALKRLADAPAGLVLVTGATGSGKTTTLASMVEYINQVRPCHIVTVEDPIEYVYKSRMAIIDQREVYKDTASFGSALKYILRQDPDVVLVGEMRDLETIETALNVAETGHLVLATLHTSDAVQTINRIVDVFPEHKQQQVRIQLSFVLNAVLCQRLVPRVGQGRALAWELMIANTPIRAMIREQKTHQIYSVIQTGKAEGMKTMNQSLADLVQQEEIIAEQALHYSSNTDELVDLTMGSHRQSGVKATP